MQFLDDAPEGSELERWEAEGERREYSNVTSWVDPEEQYLLKFTYDDPVDDFLLRLFRLSDNSQETLRSSERRIAQTLHVDEEATLQAAVRLAAAADEVDAVDEDPTIGPDYPDMEAVLHPDYTPAPPEGWEDRPEERPTGRVGRENEGGEGESRRAGGPINPEPKRNRRTRILLLAMATRR